MFHAAPPESNTLRLSATVVIDIAADPQAALHDVDALAYVPRGSRVIVNIGNRPVHGIDERLVTFLTEHATGRRLHVELQGSADAVQGWTRDLRDTAAGQPHGSTAPWGADSPWETRPRRHLTAVSSREEDPTR